MKRQITKEFAEGCIRASENELVKDVCKEIISLLNENESLKQNKSGLSFFHRVADYLMEHPELDNIYGLKGGDLIRYIAYNSKEEGDIVKLRSSDLFPILSISTKEALKRTRDGCIETGLLKYVNHSKLPADYSVVLP